MTPIFSMWSNSGSIGPNLDPVGSSMEYIFTLSLSLSLVCFVAHIVVYLSPSL